MREIFVSSHSWAEALALRSQFIFLENNSQLSTIFSILLKHSRQDALKNEENNCFLPSTSWLFWWCWDWFIDCVHTCCPSTVPECVRLALDWCEHPRTHTRIRAHCPYLGARCRPSTLALNGTWVLWVSVFERNTIIFVSLPRFQSSGNRCEHSTNTPNAKDQGRKKSREGSIQKRQRGFFCIVYRQLSF